MKFCLELFTNHLFIIKKLQRDIFKKYSRLLEGYILDLGCGQKSYKEYVKYRKYIGIDRLESVKPDICAESESVPFRRDFFNGVICTELLEHLKEPERCLLEIKRVLKSGGYVYITVPQSWGLHYEPTDYWRFTKNGITYLLRKFNFKILRFEKVGGIFSLIGQELADVFWTRVVIFFSFLGLKWSEKIASAACFFISLTFYFLGKFGDKIDDRYCLGWAVLAKK